MKKPNVVLLSLAIATAVSACSGEKPPAATTDPSNAGAKAAKAAKADLPPLAAFNVADLDLSKNACTNLGDFVNSKWLAANPVPGDKTSWGSFEMLAERSVAANKALVESAMAKPEASGMEKLVGDIYATGMDEAAIEAAGITPLKPILDRIDSLKTPADIAGYLRDEFAAGRGEVFGFYPQADFKNSDMVIAYADQGGLSLPEKTYYLEDGPDGKYKAIREAFVTHVAEQLENAGLKAEAAHQQAKDVLAFETRLAKASFTPIELRDPKRQYHLVSVADADKASPHFSWSDFFTANGLKIENFSLSQPQFFKEFNKMLADAPVAQWQAYLRINALDGMAPFLASKFNDERFDFYSKTLRGQKEQKPRWKRVLDTVERSSGEALGQLYVNEYFPAESKAAMETLVGNLREALKARLEKLDWMSPETKAKAMDKWASFTPKIGYPDKWRSWEGLASNRESYVQNVLAASKFNHDFEMAKIGKPVDRTEWGMTPQTVNAYYNPLMNEVVFPAAILQPPFFDPKADPALNYGGIGAVIGHEMLHGYDDQGSQFDAKGNFNNWWTASDSKGFKERTTKLIKQFDDYEAIEGLHVKGELTLGENIADLGGLTVSYDALQKALADAGKSGSDKIDGYTEDQRFFMNWATVWRRNFTPDELKVRLNTDPHAPANFRAIGTPSNLPAFAAAFSCKAGDGMVRPDASRVVIW